MASHAYRAVLLMGVLWLGLACGPRGGPPPEFGAGPIVVAKASPETSALERKMHGRLNRDRAKAGLPPLTFDADLADIARAHSKDMQDQGFFAHDSPRTGSLQDRLDRAGRLVKVARENIGEGADVDSTQDALLDSPGHHANIMAKDVSHIGIGILVIGEKPQQRLLVTQVFATPVKNQDPGAARGVLSSRIAQARRQAGLGPLAANPRLQELAKKYIDQVTTGESAADSERIGNAVTSELEGSGLKGVIVATSMFLAADMYEPSPAITSSEARAIGIATAPGTDERGRPAIKALFLIGL